jgi:hypothetical protein
MAINKVQDRVQDFQSVINPEQKSIVLRFDGSQPSQPVSKDSFEMASNENSLRALESGGNIASNAEIPSPSVRSRFFRS